MIIKELNWSGPFAYPGFEEINGLPELPKDRGVYLHTFDYKDGFIPYGAGVTRRYFIDRFIEHRRSYRKGEYTILVPESASNGIRDEVWHGWGWTPEKREYFNNHQSELINAANYMMEKYRIFTVDLGTEKRIHERLEAAIMNHLYSCESPFCDLPDKGMFLAPIWESEEAILLQFNSSETLYSLPKELVI